MPFNMFPYSNLHGLNADWLLQTVKTAAQQAATASAQAAQAAAQAAAAAAQAAEFEAQIVSIYGSIASIEDDVDQLQEDVSTAEQGIDVLNTWKYLAQQDIDDLQDDVGNAVSFTEDQTGKTSGEKAQARANIEAMKQKPILIYCDDDLPTTVNDTASIAVGAFHPADGTVGNMVLGQNGIVGELTGTETVGGLRKYIVTSLGSSSLLLPKALRVDVAMTLTDAEKSLGRGNIAALENQTILRYTTTDIPATGGASATVQKTSIYSSEGIKEHDFVISKNGYLGIVYSISGNSVTIGGTGISAGFLPKSGGTMAGNLNMGHYAISNVGHFTAEDSVDIVDTLDDNEGVTISVEANVSGGTMAPVVNFTGSLGNAKAKLGNVADPVEDDQAATKGFVKELFFDVMFTGTTYASDAACNKTWAQIASAIEAGKMLRIFYDENNMEYGMVTNFSIAYTKTIYDNVDTLSASSTICFDDNLTPGLVVNIYMSAESLTIYATEG